MLACETDFVAKNPTFLGLADQILDIFVEDGGEYDSYDAFPEEVKEKAQKVLTDNFVTIGENMKIVDAFAQK